MQRRRSRWVEVDIYVYKWQNDTYGIPSGYFRRAAGEGVEEVLLDDDWRPRSAGPGLLRYDALGYAWGRRGVGGNVDRATMEGRWGWCSVYIMEGWEGKRDRDWSGVGWMGVDEVGCIWLGLEG